MLGRLNAGVAELTLAVEDQNSYVCVAAIKSLGLMRREDVPQETIDLLLSMLDDYNDFVCSEAMQTLAQLKVVECIPTLIEFLNDKNPNIVSRAIQSLGKLNAKEAVPQLREFLFCKNPYIQVEAIRAVTGMDDASIKPELLNLLVDFCAVPNDKRNNTIMGVLIEACGRFKIAEAAPYLIEIAQNRVGLRGKAVGALVECGASEAAPILIKMINDPSLTLRQNLIQLMVKSNYRDALPLLRPLLFEQASHSRRMGLTVVDTFVDTVSVPVVKEICLGDSNPYNRIYAVQVLVRLIGTQAIPLLVQLSTDTNSGVRKAAAEEMEKLGAATPEVATALSAMIQSDGDVEVVEVATRALTRLNITLQDASLAVPQQRIVSLVPDEIRGKAGQILQDLNQWQIGLSAFTAPDTLNEVNEIDRALTTLQRHLQNLEK